MSAMEHASFDPAAGARSAVVNRTRRVVRQRANEMQQRRRELRDLVLPLLICSAVLAMIVYAGWSVFAQGGFGLSALEEEAGRMFSTQVADAGGTGSLLLLWFVPLSFLLLALLVFRPRSRGGPGSPGGAAR